MTQRILGFTVVFKEFNDSMKSLDVTQAHEQLTKCGKQGCPNPAKHVSRGSLAYRSCDEHFAEIEALTRAEG